MLILSGIETFMLILSGIVLGLIIVAFACDQNPKRSMEVGIVSSLFLGPLGAVIWWLCSIHNENTSNKPEQNPPKDNNNPPDDIKRFNIT